MTTRRPRVLVVDDSAFARKVVREVLLEAGCDVVDHARDGLEALEKLDRLDIDVVTLDLIMPHLDGLGFLRELNTRAERPAVVVVSTAAIDSEAGLTALELGALGVVHKPTTLATARLYEIGDELVELVMAAPTMTPPPGTAAPVEPAAPPPAPARHWQRPEATTPIHLVVIGASTGGPQALTRLVRALPADLAAPVVIALHIPAGYTRPLAERLDAASAIHVFEAYEGAHLEPGTVAVARAGLHVRVRRGPGGELLARLDVNPVSTAHHPSVDVLFESAAQICGAHTLAIVLTGMGDDGLQGSRALHASGATILTESEASCVVWGMPRSVWEAGLASRQLPLSLMATTLTRLVGRAPPGSS